MNKITRSFISMEKLITQDLKKTLRKHSQPIQKQTLFIIYTGKKLFSQLNNIKDPTPFEGQHDLVYRSVCNNDNCNDDYIEEIARRLKERVKDHNGRDKKFHLVKPSIESRYSW